MLRISRHPAGYRPIHPGDRLREDYLPDHGLMAYGLAEVLRAARGRIESLVCEQRSITPDVALWRASGTRYRHTPKRAFL